AEDPHAVLLLPFDEVLLEQADQLVATARLEGVAAQLQHGSRDLSVRHRRPAGELHDPVRLPGLASVRGEGLLPTTGGPGDRGPDEPDVDAAALEHLLVVELAVAVPEGADHGDVEDAGRAGRPVDAPLPRPGVEQAQGEGL